MSNSGTPDSRFLRVEGTHRGDLIIYPFGVVFLPEGSSLDMHPLETERVYTDLSNALLALGAKPQQCRVPGQPPDRRFRILAGKDGRAVRSKALHTYTAACTYITHLEWRIRLDHQLLLPFEFTIEDSRTGLIEQPRVMSDLGAMKDVVHLAPPVSDGPNYVIALPEGGAAIWSGSQPKEEFWSKRDLMLRRYGIGESPRATPVHDLTGCSIVRPEGDHGDVVVIAEPYHSVLHAGRVACQLRDQTGIECLVDTGNDLHRFTHAILGGDVIRMAGGRIEIFDVERDNSGLVLTPRAACELRRFDRSTLN